MRCVEYGLLSFNTNGVRVEMYLDGVASGFHDLKVYPFKTCEDRGNMRQRLNRVHQVL